MQVFLRCLSAHQCESTKLTVERVELVSGLERRRMNGCSPTTDMVGVRKWLTSLAACHFLPLSLLKSGSDLLIHFASHLLIYNSEIM